ncbi:MAG: hypothetical protein WDN04_00490 [Rhodospirillales bacterium]
MAAIALPPGPIDPNFLLALADPTRRQEAANSSTATLPPHADAALKLAKHGRLLPAVVVAPADPEAAPALHRVDAADVLAYQDQAAGDADPGCRGKGAAGRGGGCAAGRVPPRRRRHRAPWRC